MRVERSPADHRVTRDALGDEWRAVLAAALPDAAWAPLANVPRQIVGTAVALQLDAVILTGGNDLGSCARRDDTEARLLAHCIGHGIPVLAVCRGLQVVQSFFGGAVT